MIAVPALFTATGCGGDVCEDAAELCGGGEGEGEAEGECSGAAECLAQCIVDAGNCDPDTALECLGNCASEG